MQRASVPVVGVVLLLAVTTVLAGAVAVSVGDAVDVERGPTARLDLTADADRQRIRLHHRGGSPIDTRAARIVVTVDGRALRYQPPVPFFAARGFRGGPTGAFNVAGETTLTAGESAAVRLASTNEPRLDPGSHVVLTVYVDGRPVGSASTVAT